MKFPKELFVTTDTVEGEKVFIAETDVKAFAVVHHTRPVAKYKLVESGRLVNKSQYLPVEQSEE